MFTRTYYLLKPLVPRRVQIALRRRLARFKMAKCGQVWPIDHSAAVPPPGWAGWPESKKFALILTHDVDTQRGHDRCSNLLEVEQQYGFVSSFNFVPERYPVSADLRRHIAAQGCEVGIHGLTHDGKLYASQQIFLERAKSINRYLAEWNCVGFRSPAMHQNLDWLHELNIEYDASTFDTDPFEPQSEGVRTIFPFLKTDPRTGKSYVELPYTLVQDFSLFVILKENSTDNWKKKLDWIASKGGMALLNTHPDYMNFSSGRCSLEEYPVSLYTDFLEYILEQYADQYWHVLPRELSRVWRRERGGKEASRE